MEIFSRLSYARGCKWTERPGITAIKHNQDHDCLIGHGIWSPEEPGRPLKLLAHILLVSLKPFDGSFEDSVPLQGTNRLQFGWEAVDIHGIP